MPLKDGGRSSHVRRRRNGLNVHSGGLEPLLRVACVAQEGLKLERVGERGRARARSLLKLLP